MGRTLVIGDIHGYAAALDAVLEQAAPTKEDRLIFLGDYTDRGPDSRGVIDRLLALETSNDCVFIGGNHDEMMRESIAGREDPGMWLGFGGDATLRSYAPDGRRIAMESVPAEHLGFLARLVDYHETDDTIFVHATVEPNVPMAGQGRPTLRWKKLYTADPHISGKLVVCGHTAQHSGLPLDYGHTLCIDTHVYGERGWLSCLDLDGMFVIQANAAGAVRRIGRGGFLSP